MSPEWATISVSDDDLVAPSGLKHQQHQPPSGAARGWYLVAPLARSNHSTQKTQLNRNIKETEEDKRAKRKTFWILFVGVPLHPKGEQNSEQGINGG